MEPEPPTAPTDGPDAPATPEAATAPEPAATAPPEAPRAKRATTAQPIATLLRVNLRGWFSAKGFWLVLAAALLPTVLVGSWVATHRADVAATDITWAPENPVEGDRVTFTATIQNKGSLAVRDFNVTMAVGRVSGNQLIAENTSTEKIAKLGAGEEQEVTLSWTARPGVYWVLAEADPATEDAIAESEEFNNQKPLPVLVLYKEQATPPTAPENITGNGTASADLGVVEVCWRPTDRETFAPQECENLLQPGENVTVSAVLRNDGPNPIANASVTLRVLRSFGTSTFPVATEETNVDLANGAEEEVTLAWRTTEGSFWVEAWIDPGTSGTDPDATDNHEAQPLVANPSLGEDLTPPAPPEKLTIKDFYLDVLSLLHLRILIPLVALFYAAGLVADEKTKGTLPYLLTRPVPRWLFPVTKFAASFFVAAIAVAVGIVVAFLILFQTPQGNVGFLTTPLFASLLTLFVYGAFFAWLGIVVDRPYLVGIAFILGWETIAANFVPWVEKLTFTYHIGKAIGQWQLDEGLQWLPAGDGVAALRNVVLAGLVFVVLAAWAMKRKEFDV